MSGTGLIKALRNGKSDVPIIVLSGGNEISTAVEAIRSGADDYIIKDENIKDTLSLSIKNILEKKRLQDMNLKLMADLSLKNTALEKLNSILSEANERLKTLDRQKTEFLNIVAHDLRTPLSSIRGFADLILMYKNRPDKHEEFLNIIKNESIRLEMLINDYLDLEKIESGQITFKRESVDIKSVINDSLVTYRGEAEEHGISLKSHFSDDIPVITADDGKIRQVVSNLLSNAIKYTPKGGTVTISVIKNGCYVEVSVEDTGSGIPGEYHKKIFDRFVQVEGGNKKVKKGTGLGLPIVKNIVEHYGGKIWVKSEYGRGAKFIFTLPIGVNG